MNKVDIYLNLVQEEELYEGKVWDKTKEIWKDHKNKIIGGLAAVTAVGGAAYGLKKHKEKRTADSLEVSIADRKERNKALNDIKNTEKTNQKTATKAKETPVKKPRKYTMTDNKLTDAIKGIPKVGKKIINSNKQADPKKIQKNAEKFKKYKKTINKFSKAKKYILDKNEDIRKKTMNHIMGKKPNKIKEKH